MICKIVWILSAALYVHGEKEAISEQKLTIHHQKPGCCDSQPLIEKKKYEYHEHAQEYPSYEFSYKVNDPITHDIKGQHETRDGDEVKGLYWLVDPNGRTRTVNYQSNGDDGFNAQVALSGSLQVEENKSKENEGGVGPDINKENIENNVPKDNVKNDDSNDEGNIQTGIEINQDGTQNNANDEENSNNAINSGQNNEDSNNNSSQEKGDKKESYENNEEQKQILKSKNLKNFRDESQLTNESKRQVRTDQRRNKRINKESIKQNEDIRIRNVNNGRNKIKSYKESNLKKQDNNIASDNNEKREINKEQNDNNNKITNKKNNGTSKDFSSNTVTSLNLDASENKILNNIGRLNTIDKKVQIYEHTIRVHHPKHVQYNNHRS